MIVKIGAISWASSLRNRQGIRSGPEALETFMPLSSFSTPSWDMESSGKSGKSGPCNVGISKMFSLVKTDTVGTPYNTNVGVQKIPDRAIWKPVVAKRNNTNPWSCSKPQILVTRDSWTHPAWSKFLPSCMHHKLPDNSLISVNL